ncbi:MAG: PAS domain S-box protein [Myxococcales bacterium]|nr:PAS domain S-box protein [Myxococcales bacterium]
MDRRLALDRDRATVTGGAERAGSGGAPEPYVIVYVDREAGGRSAAVAAAGAACIVHAVGTVAEARAWLAEAAVDVVIATRGSVAVEGAALRDLFQDRCGLRTCLVLTGYADARAALREASTLPFVHHLGGAWGADEVGELARAARARSSAPCARDGAVLEARLRAATELQSLLESAPDAVVVSDRAGRIRLVNRQAETLFGYGREELVGERVERLVPEPLRAAHVAHRCEYRGEHDTRTMAQRHNLRARRKDGSEVAVAIRLAPLETRDGPCVFAAVRDVTGEQATAEALRQSEERFALAMETASDGLFDWDMTTGAVYYSPRFCALLGYEPAEVEPALRSWAERVPVEERDAFLAELTSWRDTPRRTRELEHRLVSRSGAVLHVVARAVLLGHEGGSAVVRAVGTVADVTSQRLAHQALATRLEIDRFVADLALDFVDVAWDKIDERVEASLKLLARHLGVDAAAVLWPARDDDRLLVTHEFVGPAFRHARDTLRELQERHSPWCLHELGRGASHAFGSPAELPPSATEERGAWDRAGVAAGVASPLRLRGLRCGALCCYAAQARPWTADDLGLLRLVSPIFIAAIQRREAEVARERFVTLVESSRDLISTSSLDGRVEYMNAAGRRLLGLANLEAARAHTIADLLAPEAHSEALGSVIPTVLAEGSWRGEQVLVDAASGERIATEGHVFLMRDARTGAPTGFGTVKRDVRAEKRARAAIEHLNTELEERVLARTHELETANSALAEAKRAAEQANETKSVFLANMSHEIRTPLNGVVGMVELLRGTALLPDQRRMLRTMADSAAGLRRILDEVLDFSKIEAGKLHVESAPLCVRAVVESAGDALAAQAREQGVELLVFVEPAIPEALRGDALRLRQILLNLGTNAVRFTAGQPGKRGTVALRAHVAAAPAQRAEPDQVVVSFEVADNGIGMCAEVLARLFRRFEQAESSTTRRHGGTGLGLAISRGLAELMGGSLTVDSVPGQGSTFRLQVPLARAVGGATPSERQAELANLRVLVVEGIGEARDAVASYVRHHGAAVMACTDAELASISERAAGEGRPFDVFVRRSGSDWLVGRHAGGLDGARLSDLVEICPGPLHHRPFIATVARVAERRDASAAFDDSGAPPSSDTPAPSVDVAASRRELVLVVDDNAINREVLLGQLAALGRAAEAVPDAASALERCRSGGIGLVLTDCHMPVMDGYSLAFALRAAESSGARRTPIIAVTASVLRGEPERCRAAGMDGYLAKPTTLAELGRAVDRWLPRRPRSGAPASERSLPPRDADARTEAAMGTTSPHVLDRTALRSIIGDAPGRWRELLGRFVVSARDLAGELRAAACAGSPEMVGRAAHKLKGSARAVGAERLAAACQSIELAVEDGRPLDVAGHDARLDELIDELVDELGMEVALD